MKQANDICHSLSIKFLASSISFPSSSVLLFFLSSVRRFGRGGGGGGGGGRPPPTRTQKNDLTSLLLCIQSMERGIKIFVLQSAGTNKYMQGRSVVVTHQPLKVPWILS
jgi:hypothetical protein